MYILYMYCFSAFVIKANTNNIIYMRTPTSSFYSQVLKIHLSYVICDLSFKKDFENWKEKYMDYFKYIQSLIRSLQYEFLKAIFPLSDSSFGTLKSSLLVIL